MLRQTINILHFGGKRTWGQSPGICHFLSPRPFGLQKNLLHTDLGAVVAWVTTQHNKFWSRSFLCSINSYWKWSSDFGFLQMTNKKHKIFVENVLAEWYQPLTIHNQCLLTSVLWKNRRACRKPHSGKLIRFIRHSVCMRDAGRRTMSVHRFDGQTAS